MHGWVRSGDAVPGAVRQCKAGRTQCNLVMELAWFGDDRWRQACCGEVLSADAWQGRDATMHAEEFLNYHLNSRRGERGSGQVRSGVAELGKDAVFV